MIEHADHYVPRFVKAGANSITVHVEAEAKHDVAKTLQQIRESDCRAGLTLNPETSFDLIEPYLHKIDILLIMTVHPGFGGQPFRADQMHKVRRARSLNDAGSTSKWMAVSTRDRQALDRKWRKRSRRWDLNFSLKRLCQSDSRVARQNDKSVDCRA